LLVAKRELEHYYPEQMDVEIERPRRLKKKKKKSYAAAKLAVIGMAMLAMIISLYILYRYANITKLRLEITELEKQRIELEREKQDLIAQLEGIKSISRVEEEAMIKLGLDYPKEEQIVYVEVEEIEIAEVEDGVNTIGERLKSVMNLFLSLF